MKTTEQGVCPVCNGTTRIPLDLSLPKNRYASSVYGFDKETSTGMCRNCGGQTMAMRPTGLVNLRPDGTPCVHEYVGRNLGRCYHGYTCKHCNDTYEIDSGD